MILRARCPALALLAACAAFAALACATPEPSRELHQWTDAEGNVRYTPFPDRIPVTQQSTRRPVVPGRSAVDNAADLPAPVREARLPRPAGAAAPPAVAVGEAGDADLEARIAALEARIAVDEETLKALISDPAQAASLRDSDALREIAQRLPGLQAELAALRAQRGAGSSAEPAPGSADVP